ncbi:MAG: hypothetical protein ACLFRU_05045, partial [Paracoccaceae bacterium]
RVTARGVKLRQVVVHVVDMKDAQHATFALGQGRRGDRRPSSATILSIGPASGSPVNRKARSITPFGLGATSIRDSSRGPAWALARKTSIGVRAAAEAPARKARREGDMKEVMENSWIFGGGIPGSCDRHVIAAMLH